MRANIQNASLGPLTALGAIPFFIQGTASDPMFQPDVNGIARENIKQDRRRSCEKSQRHVPWAIRSVEAEIAAHASSSTSRIFAESSPA